MRHDATIDKKQVRCPKASTIGHSKRVARVGDFIVFNDAAQNQQKTLGRMIGRVSFANMPGGAWIKNYLVVLKIDTSFYGVRERWVDPKDVLEVRDPKDMIDRYREVVTHFLSDDFCKHPVDTNRAFAESGFTTMEKFLSRHKYARTADYSKRDPIPGFNPATANDF